MSIYVTTDSGDIIEFVRTPVGLMPMQTVFKNRKLVSEIFHYGRSHFSVENNDVFIGYTLDRNFGLLRKMCSLGDPTTEHVSSLISEFSVTDEDGTVHTVPVGEGKYKSALFLYWLSEGQSKFAMGDIDRIFVWDYFGDEICRDALENPQTKHTTVKYLLNTYHHQGSRVTITRPGDLKKGADSIFAIPDWEEHAHQFRNGAFGYISKSVLFVRGSDNKIYLTRPYGELTGDQKDAYNDYVHQNGSTQIIPDGMDIQEIIMDDSSIIGLSAKV